MPEWIIIGLVSFFTGVAASLGLEEGTVKSRISRARLALRKYLVSTGNFPAHTSSTKANGPPSL